MRAFKDNAGRTWTVAINVAAIKRVRGLAGVDLFGLVDDGFKGLAKLLGDPIDLVDVLYVLCKDEADKLGITDEDFGRAMAGDAIGSASDAFLEELTDFFPDPRVRAGMRKVIDAGRKVRDRMLVRMDEKLNQIDPDAEARKLIDSSISSPESSESTPDPSPSGNSTTWPTPAIGPAGITLRTSSA
jgi:hypothetical protein